MTKPEPVAWIQHHKGGDNLVWNDPGGKKTAIYTADYQAAVQAYADEITETKAEIERLRAENLMRGNVMGRIAIELFGSENNRSDEECVEGLKLLRAAAGHAEALASAQAELNALLNLLLPGAAAEHSAAMNFLAARSQRGWLASELGVLDMATKGNTP